MKTKNVFLLTVFFLSALALFSQTANVQQGCAPLTVIFSPQAGSTSHFWTFGNGNVSQLPSPSATYSSPGTYTAEYRNSQNGPVLGSIVIEVYPKPVISLNVDPEEGCRPQQVQFAETIDADQDINILGYQWTFGDGSPFGNGSNPVHTYNVAGTFNVSLAITTNFSSCNVNQVFNDVVLISNSPQVAISTSPNPPTACDPPLTVNFGMATSGGQAPLTFAWDFANGNTSNQQMPPAQTYTADGLYPVTLTVTDNIGCSTTVTRNVSIGNPTIEIGLPDTICINVEYEVPNNSANGVYLWDLADALYLDNSTPASIEPKVIYQTGGLRTISLTVTAPGGCMSTETRDIYVQDVDSSFTIDPNYSCNNPESLTFNPNSNEGVAWFWIFSDMSTSTDENPTHLWENPVTDNFGSAGEILDTTFFVITTAAGCKDTSINIATIYLPNAKFLPNVQHGCAPLMVTMYDSSLSNESIVSYTYIWDDGTPNTTVVNGDSVMHTFAQAGEYNVTLIIENAAGCRDTSYEVLIEVGEPLSGDFSAVPTTACPGDTIQFNALANDPRIDGFHFSTDADRMWHCFNDPDPQHSFITEAGVYDVDLIIDYNGCINTISKADYLTINGPIAKAKYSTDCDSSYRFEFVSMSTGADTVRWFIEGDSITADSFVYYFGDSGERQIVLKAINTTSGCPISYDTFSVYPTMIQSDWTLPDTLCGGSPFNVDGGSSTDVNAVCHKGYTWYFSFNRPLRTEMPVSEVVIPITGNHTIALEVEDINGCKDTLEKEFVAIELTPDFTFSDTLICNPTTVTFTDLTFSEYIEGIDTWEWDFGDGAIGTDSITMHTFTTPPPNGLFYEVTLMVTDKFGCPQSITKPIFWYTPSTVISSLTVPAICIGDDLTLFASDYTDQGSNLTWDWDYNGQPMTGQSVTYTFNTSGIQTVSVEATEIASGCPVEAEFQVDVQEYPDAMLTSDPNLNGILCSPINISFDDNSISATPTTATWDFGNGSSGVGPQVSSVYEKGSYTLKMIASTSNGCSDSTTVSFEVVGPEGDFDQDKIIICEGDEVMFTAKNLVDISSFTWDFGDGTTVDDQQMVTHTFNTTPPTNVLTIQLILRGQNDACTFVVEKPLNFSPVKAEFTTQNPIVCAGSPHVFLNTSIEGNLVNWDFGDGSTSNNAAAAINHVYNAPGLYDVTLIVTDDPLGCMDTTMLTVQVNDVLEVEAPGDNICPGETATLTVNSPIGAGYTYNWSPANQLATPANGQTVTTNALNESVDFTVVVSDATGCTGEATVSVFVPSLEDVAFDFDTAVACDETVNLPIDFDPNKYNYSIDNEPADELSDFTITATASDTFIIRVSDKFGCVTDSFRHIVRVIPLTVGQFNAFTPNGDNTNDVFRLKVKSNPELVTVEFLKIYNRWGNLVFEGSGTVASVVWDGTVDGKRAPSDVYVWHALVTFPDGSTDDPKGEVNLIR